MNKQEIYNFLNEKDIWHEITEHSAVYNMEESSKIEKPYPDRNAKNIFVRDGKHKNYCLITVQGSKRLDLKDFRQKQGTKSLSFAYPEELKEYLDLTPGAVSPFGLLNDSQCKVHFYIDRYFLNGSGLIGIHPNDNTSKVWMKAEDLVKILSEHGTVVTVSDFE